MSDNKKENREKGSWYEELALEYLKKKGCQFIDRNFRTRSGEIDLIVKDGEYLVFVEVKYRKDSHMGMPFEAVDFRKQKQICKTSDFYRMKNQISEFDPMRFDVVSICGHEIEWIKNAFEYIGRR